MRNDRLNEKWFTHSDFNNPFGSQFTISVDIIPDPKGGVCIDRRCLALLSGNLAADRWDDAHLTDSEKLLLEAFITSIVDRQYPRT